MPKPGPAPDGSGATHAGSSQRAALPRRTALQTVAVVVFGLLGALCAFLALSFTVFGAEDPELSTGEWIAISAFLWGFTGLVSWPAVSILRRTRRL